MVKELPRVYAEFTHGPVPPWAMSQALRRIDWGFLADGWSPEMQISSFDSMEAQQEMGWSDEDRIALEKHLNAKQGLDFILVEPEKAPKPWATYDKLFARKGMTHEQAIAKITEIILDTGVDPNIVVEYERENKNREDVIQAVENLGLETGDEDIVVGA
jgi:hypothetical protein